MHAVLQQQTKINIKPQHSIDEKLKKQEVTNINEPQKN